VTLHWNEAAVAAMIRRGIEDGVTSAAQHLLTAANRHIPEDRNVPESEHRLERSGKASSAGDTAAVSYDTPYAVVEHERLDYHHQPGREAKWLERAGNQEGPQLAEIIAAKIRAQIHS
jgi:hypothetical protein